MARITLVVREETGSTVERDYFMLNTGGYIRYETPGRAGVLGAQIVWPASRRQQALSTVSATPETFENVLRRWAERQGVDVIGTFFS